MSATSEDLVPIAEIPDFPRPHTDPANWKGRVATRRGEKIFLMTDGEEYLQWDPVEQWWHNIKKEDFDRL